MNTQNVPKKNLREIFHFLPFKARTLEEPSCLPNQTEQIPKLHQLEKRKELPELSLEHLSQAPENQSLWQRSGNFLKGALIEGPAEMISGFIRLTPAHHLIEHIKKEWKEPGYHQELFQTQEGRQSLFKEQILSTPGVEPLIGLTQVALHPVATAKEVKEHYKQEWQTDEGKGKIVFELVSTLAPFSKASEISRFLKLGTFKKIPLGAANMTVLKNFGTELLTGLEDLGVKDSKLFILGSSVTGKSFKTGLPFDVGRVSDWDLAIASPSLLEKAKEVHVPLRSGRTRSANLDLTKKFPHKNLEKMNLTPLAEKLSAQINRNVSFMIYQSEEAIAQRQTEYLKIYFNKPRK